MLKPAIGIFGGTFAPIHNGHLRLAIEARDRLGMAEVRLITTAVPPHREAPAVPPERRHLWVRLAVDGEPGLVADDRELQRGGPSYTVDTLHEMRRQHPDTPLCLLVGGDATESFHTWWRYLEIEQLAHVVVFQRPGVRDIPGDFIKQYWKGEVTESPDVLKRRPYGCWYFCSVPALDISSTRIRRLLKAGRSIRGLVPDGVLAALTPADKEALTRDESPAID